MSSAAFKFILPFLGGLALAQLIYQYTRTKKITRLEEEIKKLKEARDEVKHQLQIPNLSPTDVLKEGNVAVITGGSSGIGFAVAKNCAKLGMKVCLADIDMADLKLAGIELKSLVKDPKDVLTVKTDVRQLQEVKELKDKVYTQFGKVDFLFNNAGITGGGGALDSLDRWNEVLDTNLWGVIHGVNVFTPEMIKQGTSAVIVNTGSKQGITTPPGDTAYNISKSGVKILTEGLQHQLRNLPDCKVNAFLLIPGWVNTSILLKQKRRVEGEAFDEKNVAFHESKPNPNAWMPSQVADVLFHAIQVGYPFYIICPDHEMSNSKFDMAIRWSSEDIIYRRPPLSRWSSPFSEQWKQVSAGI